MLAAAWYAYAYARFMGVQVPGLQGLVAFLLRFRRRRLRRLWLQRCSCSYSFNAQNDCWIIRSCYILYSHRLSSQCACNVSAMLQRQNVTYVTVYQLGKNRYSSLWREWCTRSAAARVSRLMRRERASRFFIGFFYFFHIIIITFFDTWCAMKI